MGYLTPRPSEMAELSRCSSSEEFEIPLGAADIEEILNTAPVIEPSLAGDRDSDSDDDHFLGASSNSLFDGFVAKFPQADNVALTSRYLGLGAPLYERRRRSSTGSVQELFSGMDIKPASRLSILEELDSSFVRDRRKFSDMHEYGKELLTSAIKEEIRCKIQLKRINTGQEELKADFSIPAPTISYDAVKKRSEVREKNKEYARQSRDRAKEQRVHLQYENLRLMAERETLRQNVSELKETVTILERDLKSHEMTCLIVDIDSSDQPVIADVKTPHKDNQFKVEPANAAGEISDKETCSSKKEEAHCSGVTSCGPSTSSQSEGAVITKDKVVYWSDSSDDCEFDKQSTGSDSSFYKEMTSQHPIDSNQSASTISLDHDELFDVVSSTSFVVDQSNSACSSPFSELTNDNEGGGELAQIPGCSKHLQIPSKQLGDKRKKSTKSPSKKKKVTWRF